MAKICAFMFSVWLLLLIEQSTSVVKIEVNDDCSSYEQRLAHLEERIEQMERTTPSTKVIAQVRLSRDLNVALNSRVLYDIEVSNIGRAFDMERGEFTAPVNGTYFVFLQACVISNVWMSLSIMKNDAEIGRLLVGDVDYHTCSSHSLVAELASGDKVWVAKVGGAASLSETNAWNTFTVVFDH